MDVTEYIVNKQYAIQPVDSCLNCQFYRAHFIKDDDERFVEVKTGTCIHPQVPKMHFIRCFGAKVACSRWQQIQPSEQKEIENPYNIIKNMATRIEQIATHLKID